MQALWRLSLEENDKYLLLLAPSNFSNSKKKYYDTVKNFATPTDTGNNLPIGNTLLSLGYLYGVYPTLLINTSTGILMDPKFRSPYSVIF